MRILVTGAGGTVGRSVADGLSRAGYEVTGIYRNRMPENVCYSLVKADLARKCPAIQEVDVIIHIAAGLSGTAKQLIHNNIKATENLVSYAEQTGVKRIVYMSTVSVHGEAEGELSEESGRRNTGLYGMTKYLSECLVRESCVPEKIILRLPRMLGPYADMEHTEGSGFLKMAKKIIEEEEVVCFIPKVKYNNFLHVDDLEKFLETLLEANAWGDCKTLLLGAKERLEMPDILKIMKDEAASGSEILIREGEKSCIPNCALIQTGRAQECGFLPESAESMLRKFIREIKNRRDIKEHTHESV